MKITLRLPTSDRQLATFTLSPAPDLSNRAAGPFNRVALAAAHVVADPLAVNDPWVDTAIDWDRTIAYREHLWDLGFGVAEAMDTAQRGMGLGWDHSLELVRRSVAAARGRGGAVFSGAGTDHLAPEAVRCLDDVVRAYVEQIAAIEALDGRVILMASRALACVARAAEDYLSVYDTILRQVKQPVIIHWLGDMFDPELGGYWGSRNLNVAMETALGAIATHPEKVDGIKISLLDKEKEIAMRRRLPDGVRMYTGDDFNYAELIAGDAQGHSDALLGIFDAIAPVASAALSQLAAKDVDGFHQLLAPTVALSRHIFREPTRFYKTGIVFLAYLNAHQDHFTMIGGQESARSAVHLAELFRLADAAGLLADPSRAASRMRTVLATHGIEA